MSADLCTAPARIAGCIVDFPDRTRWRRFVDEHPKGSIFHTPEMFEVFRRTKRHSPNVLAALDRGGEILALVVSVHVQTLPDPLAGVSSRVIFYAEPLCRETSEGIAALAELLQAHDAKLRHKALFAEVRMVHAAGVEAGPLAVCGYEFDPFVNFLIDLRRSRDELWRALSNTCRANVRRAQKHGVEVREATDPGGVEVLYGLLRQSFHRAKVPLADISLFRAALEVLGPLGMLKIFVAYHQGEPVGASALLLYKDVEYEWYWGVRLVKSIYPAECITWHRIEWGQQHGFGCYDFGGAGAPDKPYGVREFKAKFGGELVHHGRYRKVYAPWKLAMAETAYDWSRKLLSFRNRSQDNSRRPATRAA